MLPEAPESDVPFAAAPTTLPTVLPVVLAALLTAALTADEKSNLAPPLSAVSVAPLTELLGLFSVTVWSSVLLVLLLALLIWEFC